MECLKLRYLSKQDISVPCGRCPFCLATRRSDWSTRLEYESKLWVHKHFVTLTYADAHLYFRNGMSQLRKSDLQLYFKKLRKAGYRLRYYAVGEYGSRTFRPHYHILLFGNIPERVLREKWDKGMVHIGQVTQASIAYCLKYVINGWAKGMRHGRVPPFATMSRKPGLGANYLSPAMLAWHKSDRKNYVLIDGEKRHLPRYYKLKIFSAIDRVRIAVRDQKAAENRLRKKLYSLRHLRNPMEYVAQQKQIAAKRIRNKNLKNLTI